MFPFSYNSLQTRYYQGKVKKQHVPLSSLRLYMKLWLEPGLSYTTQKPMEPEVSIPAGKSSFQVSVGNKGYFSGNRKWGFFYPTHLQSAAILTFCTILAFLAQRKQNEMNKLAIVKSDKSKKITFLVTIFYHRLSWTQKTAEDMSQASVALGSQRAQEWGQSGITAVPAPPKAQRQPVCKAHLSEDVSCSVFKGWRKDSP